MAQEQLEKARDLIRHRQYDDARALLETVDHPTAIRWLAKLDEIAPERQTEPHPLTPSPFHREGEKGISEAPPHIVERGWGEVEKTVQKPTQQNEYKPWNPGVLGAATFFATSFVSGTLLSLNWRCLGKPDYLAPTLLLTFALPGLVLLIIYTIISTSIRTGVNAFSTFPFVFALMLSAGANIFFIFGTVSLQNRGYKVWKQQGNSALQQVKYPVYRVSAICGSLALLFALVASAVLWSNLQARLTPRTLVSGNVILNYLPEWEVVDVGQIIGCNDPGMRCVAALSLSPFYSTALLIAEFNIDEGTTASEIEQTSWEFLLDCPDCSVELDLKTDGIVGNLPAVTRQYWLTDFAQNGERTYIVQTYVVVGNLVYEVTVTTPNPGIYRENRTQVESVLTSIQFHETGNAV